MRKLFKVFFTIVAMPTAIIILSILLYQAHQELNDLSFHEGNVVEFANGEGIVTVSTDWIVFENDDFIKNSPSPDTAKSFDDSFDDIYCILHKSGVVTATNGCLAKVSFDKQIVVKDGEGEKVFYLVENENKDYYITSPITTPNESSAEE